MSDKSKLDSLMSLIHKTEKVKSDINIPALNVSSHNSGTIDRRSRAEVREDFEKKLEEFDKPALLELKKQLEGLKNDSDKDIKKLWSFKEDLENALTKLIKYIDQFEDLNSEESRAVARKQKELQLEGKHDWYAKFRLFFFRVLTSALFVITLFAIGYIEREYEWATLPLSKYVKPLPSGAIK